MVASQDKVLARYVQVHSAVSTQLSPFKPVKTQGEPVVCDVQFSHVTVHNTPPELLDRRISPSVRLFWNCLVEPKGLSLGFIL